MISLMEALFYHKRLRTILLYYCRDRVIIAEAKLRFFYSISAFSVKHKGKPDWLSVLCHVCYIRGRRPVHRAGARGCLADWGETLWAVKDNLVWNRYVNIHPLWLFTIIIQRKERSHRENKTPVQNCFFFRGTGMNQCCVNCSLILNKEVTVGGTWHPVLAPQSRLQVMAGHFVHTNMWWLSERTAAYLRLVVWQRRDKSSDNITCKFVTSKCICSIWMCIKLWLHLLNRSIF